MCWKKEAGFFRPTEQLDITEEGVGCKSCKADISQHHSENRRRGGRVILLLITHTLRTRRLAIIHPINLRASQSTKTSVNHASLSLELGFKLQRFDLSLEMMITRGVFSSYSHPAGSPPLPASPLTQSQLLGILSTTSSFLANFNQPSKYTNS